MPLSIDDFGPVEIQLIASLMRNRINHRMKFRLGYSGVLQHPSGILEQKTDALYETAGIRALEWTNRQLMEYALRVVPHYVFRDMGRFR